MGYAIGSLTKGAGDDCHYQMLDVIKTLAEANGWTTQRYVSTGLDREWIGKSLGLSGTEEIFIGFRTYQDVGADYYNLVAATFIGYVAANSFDSQPGIKLSGVPAHNNAIDYFLIANAQRIAFCLKVGTPVYEHAYAGKFFPYARPGEYPSPLVVGGMFYGGAEARRFSDADQQWPYTGKVLGTGNEGSAMWTRDQAGNWEQRYHYPFSNGDSRAYALFSTHSANAVPCLVPANDYYQIEPIIIQDQDGVARSNIYGELDGVYAVSGFNNGPENVIQLGGSSVVDQTGLTVNAAVSAILAVGGRAFVVVQNVNRTTWSDFVALEMVA